MTAPLLWVAPEPVDRATGGGGGIRHTHLLRRLAAEVPVRLVALGPRVDDRVADAVEGLVLVSPDRGVGHRAAAAAARGLAGRSVPEVDALAPFAAQVPRAWLDGGTSVLCHLATQDLAAEATGPVVTHLFHRPSAQLADEAERATAGRRVRLRRYAATAERMERAAAARAALTVVVTEADADGLSGPGATAEVAVVPNGVDTSAPDPGPAAAPRVLMPGTLFYGPNVDGARWFVDEAWPGVRAAVPQAELVLAGRGPTPEVRALAERPGVAVRADVDDMAAELAAARVVVVPLRYGTGTRVKALEALAGRRALVGTTVGLAGLGIEDGVHARVADDPAALARATVAALADGDDALVARGRELVERHHTWDAQAERLLTALGARALLPSTRRVLA
ncbi:MAG TPA: glycosyltransferase family 4 protein [Iamia sp.]|nr:glycosyltransferase family 4 protein [Iamia sp.]